MRRHPVIVVVAVIALILILVMADRLAWGSRGEDINDFRADHGRPGLQQRDRLQESAVAYAEHLAAGGRLVHDDRWVANHEGSGEIIGFGPDWDTILVAWKHSTCKGPHPDGPCPEHRELLLDRDFTRMGIGCEEAPLGTLFCVVRFR